MDREFWLDRWAEGRIGFHQPQVTPLLEQYWSELDIPAGSRVLVPLCGKSLDMLWLSRQGFSVLGVELSPLAIEQFLEENQLQGTTHTSPMGKHTVLENIELICGDIFDIDEATLRSCTAVYDRAALIALPQDMRQRYVDHVYGHLAPGYEGLLITLSYDQQRMDGPPFSVPDAEVRALYQAHSQVELLHTYDTLKAEPRFKERGLNSLETLAYRLRSLKG